MCVFMSEETRVDLRETVCVCVYVRGDTSRSTETVCVCLCERHE